MKSTNISDIIEVLRNFGTQYSDKIQTNFICENSNRIVFRQYIDSKDRFNFVKFINSFIKNSNEYIHIEIFSMRSSKDYAFKLLNCDKCIYVQVKPIGNHSGVSCHEFLTAALVLLGIKEYSLTDDNVTDLYSNIEHIVCDNKIKNYTLYESNLIEYDTTSLCQAISASKQILNIIKTIPDIAYLTGNGKWDNDISFLDYKHENIKKYNSADIVFKVNDKYYGFSLKKKKYISDKDPPLINRSLICMFEKDIQKELSDILSKYFINILNKFYKNKIIEQHPNINNWKKLISEIDLKLINDRIKDDKCILWKNIRELIFKHSNRVCKNIIDHVLRINLLSIDNFIFFNVTGIGRYQKDKGFIIEHGEILSLNHIISTYDKLDKSNISIKRNRDKESEFQSTLFLTIYLKDVPIINLEIRYKGRFHTSPEVLAFFTKEFRNMVSDDIDNK